MAVAGINPNTAGHDGAERQSRQRGDGLHRAGALPDYGPHISLAAPTQVPTTDLGGGYTLNWSGTSAATPHVAGVADLVIARAGSWGSG